MKAFCLSAELKDTGGGQKGARPLFGPEKKRAGIDAP